MHGTVTMRSEEELQFSRLFLFELMRATLLTLDLVCCAAGADIPLFSVMMKPFGVVCIAWSLAAISVDPKSVSWLSDEVKISIASYSYDFILSLQASRKVLPATSGHFKLAIVRNGVRFSTSCISYGTSSSAISDALQNLTPIHDLGGVAVVQKVDGSLTHSYGFSYRISASNTNESLTDSVELAFVGSGVEIGCARLSTLGFWNEAANWEENVVPSISDEVAIPADAGFVVLTENTVISTLEMSGGALVTHDTTCLSGWSPAPGGISSPFGPSKCYHVFRDPKSWGEAQNACATAVGAGEMGTRGGALRGALVTVQSLEENQWVQRLCKGGDCWVGMTRGAGATDLEWADLELTEGDSRYRSWARREPSVFESDEDRENCVAIRSSGRIAAEQGEARWYDEDCELLKPYVCQAFGVSQPFSLTVSTALNLNGGHIIGAGSVISSASAKVSGSEGEVGLFNGATLVNYDGGSMDWSAPLTVALGGALQNKGVLTFTSASSFAAAVDSEGMWVDNTEAWPVLMNEEKAVMFFEAKSVVEIDWLLWNDGGSVSVLGDVAFAGGGYSSSGKIFIGGSATASFSSNSFAMHQLKVFVVLLQADRKVAGQDAQVASERGGYFRLVYRLEETRCISYHASDKVLQAALEDLATVKSAGGVTVQRDGNGESRRWNFGYRHVVTFDDASASNDYGNLTLSCAGSAGGCGCVDVTGAIEGPGGSRVGCGTATIGVEDTSTSARFNNSDCLIQATVDVSMLLEGGETYVGGGGSLAFSGAGQFLLPSLVEADVEVRSLAEAVVPRRSGELTGTVNVTSGGVLWFSGGDWNSLDAVLLLYAQPSAEGRKESSVSSPPEFNSTIIGDLVLESGGEVRLAATPLSMLMVLGHLTLGGGGLSGQGRVIVLAQTSFVRGRDPSGFTSSLQNGVILDMSGGGEWVEGDVTASDGAAVVIHRYFEISAGGRATFGEGEHSVAGALLEFDGVSWYKNPLCGDHCSKSPSWETAADGMIVGAFSSNVVLYAILLNEGSVVVEDGGRLEWAGAGEGGGDGVILLRGSNSTLVVSDGSFVLNATANVSGNGVLEFSGGTGHELAAIVLPLVIVSRDGVLTFHGHELSLRLGLMVTDNGIFNFSANTVSTSIDGDLALMKNGLIKFPSSTMGIDELLLSAERGVETPWGSDGWGDASRGSVRVNGNFKWSGGTISGNAKVTCLGDSEWDGESNPKMLLDFLHLVSIGNVVWSRGDVLVANGAEFVNRGTLLPSFNQDTGTLDFAPRIRSLRPEENMWQEDRRLAIDGAASVALAGLLEGEAAAREWQ